MKLPKHKLPKSARAHKHIVKHEATAARQKIREERKNQMDTDEGNKAPIVERTPEEKAKAKLERKKLRPDNVAYKKRILNRTHSNGPRAISK